MGTAILTLFIICLVFFQNLCNPVCLFFILVLDRSRVALHFPGLSYSDCARVWRKSRPNYIFPQGWLGFAGFSRGGDIKQSIPESIHSEIRAVLWGCKATKLSVFPWQIFEYAPFLTSAHYCLCKQWYPHAVESPFFPSCYKCKKNILLEELQLCGRVFYVSASMNTWSLTTPIRG